jgi:hypothetical protein
MHIHGSHVRLSTAETVHYPSMISYTPRLFHDKMEIDWQSATLDLISYTPRLFHDKMEIDWQSATLDLPTLQESLSLPSAIIVPLLETRKVRAIISQSHTIRLFIVSDGIIYTALGPLPHTGLLSRPAPNAPNVERAAELQTQAPANLYPSPDPN